MAVTTTLRCVNEKHFIGIDSGNHAVVLSGQTDGIGVMRVTITDDTNATTLETRDVTAGYHLSGFLTASNTAQITITFTSAAGFRHGGYPDPDFDGGFRGRKVR